MNDGDDFELGSWDNFTIFFPWVLGAPIVCHIEKLVCAAMTKSSLGQFHKFFSWFFDTHFLSHNTRWQWQMMTLSLPQKGYWWCRGDVKLLVRPSGLKKATKIKNLKVRCISGWKFWQVVPFSLNAVCTLYCSTQFYKRNFSKPRKFLRNLSQNKARVMAVAQIKERIQKRTLERLQT